MRFLPLLTSFRLLLLPPCLPLVSLSLSLLLFVILTAAQHIKKSEMAPEALFRFQTSGQPQSGPVWRGVCREETMNQNDHTIDARTSNVRISKPELNIYKNFWSPPVVVSLKKENVLWLHRMCVCCSLIDLLHALDCTQFVPPTSSLFFSPSSQSIAHTVWGSMQRVCVDFIDFITTSTQTLRALFDSPRRDRRDSLGLLREA